VEANIEGTSRRETVRREKIRRKMRVRTPEAIAEYLTSAISDMNAWTNSEKVPTVLYIRRGMSKRTR